MAYLLANDPITGCDPIGYPRIAYTNNRSFEFIQTATKIVQIFEWTHGLREIWLDGRKIPEDLDPRWYGYAVGHWEGSTLVVDSRGYNEKMARPLWRILQRGYDDARALCASRCHDLAADHDAQRFLKVYTEPWVSAKPAALKAAIAQGRDRTRGSLVRAGRGKRFQ